MNWLYTRKDVTLLQLEVTSFCNLKCPACEREFGKSTDSLKETADVVYKNQLKGRANKTTKFDFDSEHISAKHINTTHMPLEKIKEWFTRETLPNLQLVTFSGAIDEPAAHPNFYEICKHFVDEFDCEVSVNTNGSIKTKEFWHKLGELGIIVEFALDGLKDTLHIYRVGADYDKVINNAKTFISAGGKAWWKFIDFKHNTHQTEEAKKIAKELSFEKFVYVNSARPASKDINTPYDFQHKENKEVTCKSTYKPWLYVNYDGVMSPCCYFGYNERSRDPKDNLYNSTIDEFFDSSKFLNTLKNNWNTDNCNRRCYIKCKLNQKDNKEIIWL